MHHSTLDLHLNNTNMLAIYDRVICELDRVVVTKTSFTEFYKVAMIVILLFLLIFSFLVCDF